MMQIVKDSGYRGYIGVEFGGFGSNLSAIEGIRQQRILYLNLQNYYNSRLYLT